VDVDPDELGARPPGAEASKSLFQPPPYGDDMLDDMLDFPYAPRPPAVREDAEYGLWLPACGDEPAVLGPGSPINA
jgi:hypothetical protein